MPPTAVPPTPYAGASVGLGQPFALKIAQGVGSNGLFGGTMLSIFEGSVVALERYGDRVFLVQRPHRFTAREGGAAARAVDLTFSPSVLESAKIEAIGEDSALAINVYDWMVSDLSGIGQAVRFVVSTTPGRPGQATFEKPKSYLESVKGFPRNVNVRAKLTFRPGEPVGWASVPDGRYISLSIHYTLAALPETPMTPRLGDDRVGQFWTIHKDFSQEDSSAYVRYVNRWRLEPGERAGDLWRPKRPITYYIDHTVPLEWRPYVRAGVLEWNRAFEEAGFKNAVQVLEAPDAEEAIASIEVIAKLLGKGSQSDAYTEGVDAWVKASRHKPGPALLQKARRVLERIMSKDSELLELWEESDDAAAWEASMANLRAAVGG